MNNVHATLPPANPSHDPGPGHTAGVTPRPSQSLAIASAASFNLATRAEQRCAVFTPTAQDATSPDAALKLLQDGNDRFGGGKDA